MALDREIAPSQRIQIVEPDRVAEERGVLLDVSPKGAESGTPEFGTGAFAQRPYLGFLATRRPDLDLIVEHMPLEHVSAVRRRLDELFLPTERREASSMS
jgi:hypothetical protein